MIESRAMRAEVGMWYSYCCELDLTQIQDDAERALVQESLEDEDGVGVRVWLTREDALSQLRAENSHV